MVVAVAAVLVVEAVHVAVADDPRLRQCMMRMLCVVLLWLGYCWCAWLCDAADCGVVVVHAVHVADVDPRGDANTCCLCCVCMLILRLHVDGVDVAVGVVAAEVVVVCVVRVAVRGCWCCC